MDSKISPVEEDVDNLGDDGNASGLTLAQERSKFSIVRKLKKLYNDFTYDNIKTSANQSSKHSDLNMRRILVIYVY